MIKIVPAGKIETSFTGFLLRVCFTYPSYLLLVLLIIIFFDILVLSSM